MIQYQRELLSHIKKIIPFQGPCYIQKIYTSSTLVCLAARFKGQTRFLYLGRGHGVEGFWVASDRLSVELRGTDRFLEYLRKYLSSTELLNISQVFNDRCLHIVYRKYGYEKNSFIFFWKGRKLYFLNYFFNERSKQFCLMRSWKKKEIFQNEITKENLYESLIEVGLNQDFGGHFKDSQTSISSIIENERKKLIKLNGPQKKLKSLKRKLTYICTDLEKIEDVFELQEKVKLGNVDFDEIDTLLVFKGIKIKINRGLNFFQKRDRVFEKIKSFKKAKKILEQRKLKTEEEIKCFTKKGPQEFYQKLPVIPAYWISTENLGDQGKGVTKHPSNSVEGKELRKHSNKLGSDIKVFKIKDYFSFAIAKNAIANDFLRSKWGSKDDLWFHLDGYSGAHVVAKESNKAKISGASLKIVASALRDYSKLRIEEVPVVFTQLRNLKGIKGLKGKIIYKKEKYMKIEYDKNWRTKVEEK